MNFYNSIANAISSLGLQNSIIGPLVSDLICVALTVFIGLAPFIFIFAVLWRCFNANKY